MAVILGTLPVITIGGLSYYSASQGNLQEISKFETTRAIELQGELNLFLQDRLADIKNIAELSILTQSTIRDQVTSQQQANALDRFMTNHGGTYSSIAFFDLQGEPIAQTSAGKRLGNHLNRTYIQAAKEANGPVISQPSISTTSGEFSIYTASVVKDPLTDRPIGYVRARIPVSALASFLEVFTSDGSEYYLANQNNEVFLGSDGSYISQINSLGQAVDGERQAIGIQDVFPDMVPFFDTGKASAQPSLNTLAAEKQLVAFATSQPIADLPDIQWTAVMTHDLSDLLLPQRRLLITIALGTAISAIAASVIAIIVTRRFTAPLREATQLVNQIGQGDLNARLTIEGNDEMAQLGQNINTMAGQLKKFTTAQQIATQRSRLLASVTSINADLASPEGQKTLNQLLQETRTFLNTDRVVIYRLEERRRGSWSGYVSHESVAEGLPSALALEKKDNCIPANLLEDYRKGRIYTVNNVHRAQIGDEHRALLKLFKVKALFVVPIVNQDRLFGLLITHHCAKPHEWSSNDIDIFQQLGQQLGVLMTVQEFASLAKEQRQIKEGLQKRALELMMEIDPVSQGDLTVRAKVTEDEIGTVADSYNATIANLRKIVLQVQTAADQMSTTVTDNRPLVEVLSTGANQQTEEISGALQQIQQMVTAIREVATSAEEAEKIVRKTTATVAASDEAMNRTVSGIMTIRETVAETAKKVKRLGEASQKISGVVNLISEFAAQTNLLALNASIEAARAGEEGRGFAVVAEEVRSLARQSAEATVEIENLVASIQTETNEVVTAMEVGTEQVVEGTQLVDETRNSLNRIEQVATQLNTLIESISQATQTQSQSSETVTTVIQNVAEIAEQTSSEASQVSISFQTLLEVTQALQASVSQFKVG
ncbi:MAG: methyl-accepting chemotaxis protein [Cyanobacteria bacterium P01_F01_bin.86]